MKQVFFIVAPGTQGISPPNTLSFQVKYNHNIHIHYISDIIFILCS